MTGDKQKTILVLTLFLFGIIIGLLTIKNRITYQQLAKQPDVCYCYQASCSVDPNGYQFGTYLIRIIDELDNEVGRGRGPIVKFQACSGRRYRCEVYQTTIGGVIIGSKPGMPIPTPCASIEDTLWCLQISITPIITTITPTVTTIPSIILTPNPTITSIPIITPILTPTQYPFCPLPEDYQLIIEPVL